MECRVVQGTRREVQPQRLEIEKPRQAKAAEEDETYVLLSERVSYGMYSHQRGMGMVQFWRPGEGKI